MLRVTARAATVCLSLFVVLGLSAAPAHADLDKMRTAGILKVAVYNDLAPFSDKGAGIDVDIAKALADKLKLKLSLLPFNAGDDLDEDLRNMVWKGHYLGYGPADVMLHVPIDRNLMAHNGKVEFIAPYYRETVRLVRSAKAVPTFQNINSLAGKTIGVEAVSIGAMVMLGAENGRFRNNVKIYPSADQALDKLKSGEVAAVVANRSQIESALKSDPAYPMEQVNFERLPPEGWVVGMAVRKQDQELAHAVQAAAQDLIASGEMAKIFARYSVAPVSP